MQGATTTRGGAFVRANATALAATVVDFLTLYILVECVHVYYVTATAVAAIAGAAANFTLNRIWAFRGSSEGPISQGLRYALVSGASASFNTGLVFCFTEFGGLRYMFAKCVAAICVGWGWNYPLQRFYVFSINRDSASGASHVATSR